MSQQTKRRAPRPDPPRPVSASKLSPEEMAALEQMIAEVRAERARLRQAHPQRLMG